MIFSLVTLALAADPVLTLNEALRIAEEQPQARIDAASVRAAAARADSARAGVLPTVDVGASWRLGTGNGTPTTAGSGVSFGSAATSSWGADLSASQLLFDGSTWAGWRAARDDARAAELEAAASRIQLRYDVRTAYFTARAAGEAVEVAREAVDVQTRHLRQVEAFIEVGTRPPIDRAQARADLANARVQLIAAENGYRVGRFRLDEAIGRASDGAYDVADEGMPPAEHEADRLDALLELASTSRPDLVELDVALDAAESSLRAEIGAHLPTVRASGSLSADARYLDSPALNWGLGINAGWTLYGGGAISASVESAQAALTAEQARADALRIHVRVQLAQAQADVAAAVATLEAAEEALLASKERLSLAEGRYEAGEGTALELEDAQLAYARAGLQRVQARLSLADARAAWLAAMGLE